jgi:hypothetical protein
VVLIGMGVVVDDDNDNDDVIVISRIDNSYRSSKQQ